MHLRYIEDITQWHEHMKFIFEWKKYFVSERNEKQLDEKQRNDVSDIFTCEDMENISLVSRM